MTVQLALLGDKFALRDALLSHRLAGLMPDLVWRMAAPYMLPAKRAVWRCTEKGGLSRVSVWRQPFFGRDRQSRDRRTMESALGQMIREGAGAVCFSGAAPWTRKLPATPGDQLMMANGMSATAVSLAMGFWKLDDELRRQAFCLVTGADTPLGTTVARLVAMQARFLTLAGHCEPALERLAGHILAESGVSVGVRVHCEGPQTVTVWAFAGQRGPGGDALPELPGPSYNGHMPAVKVPEGLLVDDASDRPVTLLSSGAAEGILLAMERRFSPPYTRPGGSVEGALELADLARRHGFEMGTAWREQGQLSQLDNPSSTSV